jgi:hypothetical protein
MWMQFFCCIMWHVLCSYHSLSQLQRKTLESNLFHSYALFPQFSFFFFFKLWSSKWSIKDEHKLLSELGSGAANGGSPYYDAQTGFPTVTTTSDLYESISTMTQAQSTPVYTPPIGTSLGKWAIKFHSSCLVTCGSNHPIVIVQNVQTTIGIGRDICF